MIEQLKISNFGIPSFLKIGRSLIADLETLMGKMNVSNQNAILISDETVWELYGNEVANQISSYFDNFEILLIDEYTINQSFKLTSKIINQYINIIIGLGGGKVLDTCKHAAYMGKIKLLSIPTTLANDGVASPIAVLKTENGIKSIGCKVPDGIIIDLDVIMNSPVELIKAGIGDTLSNYTAILDWKLAEKKGKERINDFALLLSDTAFNSLLHFSNKNIYDYNFLKQLAESIVLSGLAMNISGNSRPCSGSEHLISHSMDLFENKNLHGIQVAVSSIVSAYLHKKDIKILRSFLEKFNLPTRFQELGYNEKDFVKIMQNAKDTRKNRYTVLNETDLSSKNLTLLYNKLFNN